MERNTALIMHQVAFGNDKIEVIEQGNELLVTMKPLCERIGLNWESQRQLIQRDEMFRQVTSMIQVTSIGKDGKTYHTEMVCLPLKYLNGWLFKVETSRYEGELKEKLIRYQKECFDVLFQHFFSKRDDYSYVDELERRTKAINAELKALKADDAFKEKVKQETSDVMRGRKKIDDLNGYPKLKEAVESSLNAQSEEIRMKIRQEILEADKFLKLMLSEYNDSNSDFLGYNEKNQWLYFRMTKAIELARQKGLDVQAEIIPKALKRHPAFICKKKIRFEKTVSLMACFFDTNFITSQML